MSATISLLGRIATPATTAYLVQPRAVDALTLTPGRIVGTAAVVVALAGVVVASVTLARSARGVGPTRRGSITALVAGLIGLSTGTIVVAVAKGGPGTGYGVVGGYVAVATGLAATVLGGLGLVRPGRRS